MDALPVILHLTGQRTALQANNLQPYCNSELGKTDTEVRQVVVSCGAGVSPPAAT
jgi:hypothetical protein